MRNETLNIGEPIPDEIRLEVYKEAKTHIENSLKNPEYDVYGLGGSMGLCILLPCVLYDLGHFCNDQPNGKDWSFLNTHGSFPEIRDFIWKIEAQSYREEKNKLRLKCLNSAIKKLSK